MQISFSIWLLSSGQHTSWHTLYGRQLSQVLFYFIHSLDNSEEAAHNEDYFPSRWQHQKETVATLAERAAAGGSAVAFLACCGACPRVLETVERTDQMPGALLRVAAAADQPSTASRLAQRLRLSLVRCF